MLHYKLAYLIGTLIILIPIWLVIFLLRRDLRRKMLLLSFFGSIVGPLSEFMFYQDYWNPETILNGVIRIEDILFGFLAVGIAGALYPYLFKKNMNSTPERKNTFIILILMNILGLGIMFILFLLGLNSMYASILSTTLLTIVVIILRKDLTVPFAISGILFLAFAFLGYQIFLSLYPEAITKWWLLNNLSNIFVFRTPIEEFLWAFATGGFTGIIYEFASTRRFSD